MNDLHIDVVVVRPCSVNYYGSVHSGEPRYNSGDKFN